VEVPSRALPQRCPTQEQNPQKVLTQEIYKHPKDMKCPKHHHLQLAAFFTALFIPLSLSAQQVAPQATGQVEEETVILSPFAMEESADLGRYHATQVSSGSRIRMDLMDSTQSISVVTKEFMVDISMARLLDAMTYTAGISQSLQAGFMDSMNIRGFARQGVTIDGFNQYNLVNQDPIIVERVEFVKGPNAILNPQGHPGGIVNNITKKPLFTNGGSLSYQVGRWDADRAEFDANYVVSSDKLAVRVVGAVTQSDSYGQRAYHHNVVAMPMFTYRMGASTQFTFQFQASNGHTGGNNGALLSVYAVGRNNVRVQEGLPHDFQYWDRNINAHQRIYNARFALDTQITDKLSMRLAGNRVKSKIRSNYLGTSDPYLG